MKPILTLKHFSSPEKGKSEAVRPGFSQATGDLLTLLDADLIMPPEPLGRFYSAYCEGHADFINGSRLVYPTIDWLQFPSQKERSRQR